MSDELSQELAELTADLKAVVTDARARGILSLPRHEEEQVGGSSLHGSESANTAMDTTEAPVEFVAPAPVPSKDVAPVHRETPQVEARDPTLYGTATGELQAIRADLGDCKRCGLCQGRANLVFGTGDGQADLLIVGEAPGAQEDRKGLPFVGPAGQMLDRMLEHVLGLQRKNVYITNVVKCRPPNNRTPDPDEISTCRPFLNRQIEAIRPKVILALGRPATQTLLETTQGITSLRGSWHTFGDVPVLPTFHPAYLLRKPQDKRLVFNDLQEVRKRYDLLGGRR